jgi:hypothetical protein
MLLILQDNFGYIHRSHPGDGAVGFEGGVPDLRIDAGMAKPSYPYLF